MQHTSYSDSGAREELSQQQLTRRLAAALGGWLLVALAASSAGLISPSLPRPIIPLLIWLPTLTFILAFARSRGVRAAVRALDMRLPILWHLCRAGYGIGFLMLDARGAIDSSFARVAGPGDILAGLGALVAALAVPATTPTRRVLVFGWNALALADILLVFVTAQRILFFGGGFGALEAFTRMPYSLLPTFVVPMILITHFVVFAKLWMREKAVR